MAEKRKRGQNFTIDEKDRLVKLLASHKETILNKKTDGSTNEAKNKAWADITNAFNSCTAVYRTKESLMKVWEKLKTESKLYYQSNQKSTSGTGGGPSEVKVDPILEQVCTLLGRACTGILGVHDSDYILVNALPKKMGINKEQTVLSVNEIIKEYEVDLNDIGLDDDDDVEKNQTGVDISHENNAIIFETPSRSSRCPQSSQINSRIETEVNNDVGKHQNPQESLHENNNNTSNKTPLWSRRRPLISQANERTEAVSSLCASFSQVNKKKLDIEELKRQLLQDEVDFKKKLYELQLQAAVKEVEIKTEILNQIKGGSLKLENLFGVRKE